MKLMKNTPEAAHIAIIPRLASDLQNYAEAAVVLDKSTYLPKAVKLYDPTGNLETVYTFDSIKINQRGIFPPIFRDKDPFHPNLKGYKLFVSADTNEAPQKPSQNDPRLNQQTVPRTGNQPTPRIGQGPIRPSNK
jgi:hypothetical protein